MSASAFGALLSAIAALGSLWAAVLWVRPVVARARVEHRVLVVQDRIWNALQSGELDWSSERAFKAFIYCDMLVRRPKELCLSNALAFGATLHRAGQFDETTAAVERNQAALRSPDADGQTPVGNRILQECEAELDKTVAWYFFRGSALWPVLTPLGWLLDRFAGRVSQVEGLHLHALDQDSTELAMEVRESSVKLPAAGEVKWSDLTDAEGPDLTQFGPHGLPA